MMEASTIKVFNLTDIPTKQLSQYKLSMQHLVVGRTMLAPGASADVPDDVVTRAGLQHYVSIGAVAVGSVPPAYAVAKAQLEAKERPTKSDDTPSSLFGKKKKD